MPHEEHLRSDDDVEAILRLAVRDQHDATNLRERLEASARELGVSSEALARAEEQYRVQKAEETAREAFLAEKREFRKHQLRGLRSHLFWYATVNLFLFAINFFSREGLREPWFLGPLLGWGIGMFFHVTGTLWPSPDDFDEEFAEWKRKKEIGVGL